MDNTPISSSNEQGQSIQSNQSTPSNQLINQLQSMASASGSVMVCVLPMPQGQSTPSLQSGPMNPPPPPPPPSRGPSGQGGSTQDRPQPTRRTGTGIPTIPRAQLKCSWCQQLGHGLADCNAAPDIYGYILGCPRCNVHNHWYDLCPRASRDKKDPDHYWLVERRDGKPLIRTMIDPRTIPGFFEREFRPLTPQEALRRCGTGYYENFTYRTTNRRPNDEPIQRDQTWDYPDNCLGPIGTPIHPVADQKIKSNRRQLDPRANSFMPQSSRGSTQTFEESSRDVYRERSYGQTSSRQDQSSQSYQPQQRERSRSPIAPRSRFTDDNLGSYRLDTPRAQSRFTDDNLRDYRPETSRAQSRFIDDNLGDYGPETSQVQSRFTDNNLGNYRPPETPRAPSRFRDDNLGDYRQPEPPQVQSRFTDDNLGNHRPPETPRAPSRFRDDNLGDYRLPEPPQPQQQDNFNQRGQSDMQSQSAQEPPIDMEKSHPRGSWQPRRSDAQ
jgi:hypothetical protein